MDFDLAATVFRGPLGASIPDQEHDDTEQRWITMGLAQNSALLVVVHTYHELNANAASVRIVSARPATQHEQRHYEA